MRVERLFFDLDGTLTDPAEGIVGSLRHALVGLGERERPVGELQRWIGPPLREAFAELLETRDPARLEQAVALYRERFGTTGLFENRVYPGIRELLVAVEARGVAMHVVTSKPWVFAQRVLDHFGLSRHFGRVFGPELTGERSSKAELVRHALETLGAGPATWMVGDRSYDVRGALANGVPAVGVTWGYGAPDELLGAGAERLFARPDEVLAWVEAAEASTGQ